jgi:hypothetical protein
MKKNVFEKLALGMICFVTTGCATAKYVELSTGAVSMTEYSLPADYKAQSIGPVEVQFCIGDKKHSRDDDSNIGLMDELILKAQTETNAKYLTNATFFTKGRCMILEATAMR